MWMRQVVSFGAALVVCFVLLGVALGFGTRQQTSYGTATSPTAYAPGVRKMLVAQRALADGFAARYAQTPEELRDLQQSVDHQSASANSLLGQATGAAPCALGTTRYLDVLHLSATVPGDYAAQPEKLLTSIAQQKFGARASVSGLTVTFARDHFRINVTPERAGSTYALTFSAPPLSDAVDTTAAKCYPVSQVPLSTVRQLG